MILLTQKQADFFEKILVNKDKKHNQAWHMAIQFKELDLVTIAKLIEGEPYKIFRPYKVGDIVRGLASNKLYEVTDKKGSAGSSLVNVDDLNKSSNPELFELVCKVENTEKDGYVHDVSY